MRLPGVIFLLAEVKLEFSPNCFQFLLAVLPHPLGTEQKNKKPTPDSNFHLGLFSETSTFPELVRTTGRVCLPTLLPYTPASRKPWPPSF